MKRKIIGLTLCFCLLLSLLLSVTVLPAFAAATATFSVSNTAGEMGETVDVSIAVSANSYLVNGDFTLSYDTAYLRYVPDSCIASTVLGDAYWAAHDNGDGIIRISFASDDSVGITAGGDLFELQFEIINNNSVQTGIAVTASPVRGCNGGDDFDIKPTVAGGTIGIVGGTDPWNFLQEAFLIAGKENVSIDQNGVWTVTGDFSLSPDFTINYSEWSYIVQHFTTNTPVKISLIDRDPLGVYGEHAIGLYDNFVGPQYYPAGSYNQVNSIKGIYDWNIKNNGWKNNGMATIDEVVVHFESSVNVSAVFTSLYMNQSQVTTSSVVRTTATKTTIAPESIGDINNDSQIDTQDLTSLIYHFNGVEQLSRKQLKYADVNANGTVNFSDVMRLFYQLNGLL